MNRIALLFLAVSLTLIGCQEDEIIDRENLLSYDGPNNTAPLLPIGEYEAAARFTSAELAQYVGQKLVEVSFFIGDLPRDCVVKIYDQGTPTTPGTLLYQASVSNSLNPRSWNNHEVRRPIDITGKDLWIAVNVYHNDVLQSIGCDAGPAIPDGDWLYEDSDQQWQTFQQRTGESINWNIRGRVAD